MRICRFDNDRIGLVQADQVRDVTAIIERLPQQRYPLPLHDVFIEHLDALKPAIAELVKSAPSIPLASVRLLSPVANPGKIVGAPVNYTKHLQEAMADKGISFGNPVAEIEKIGCFLKANSSLVGPAAGVTLTMPQRRNDHEIELVVVIGRPGRNIRVEDAMSHVAGYCIGLDMTLRGAEDRSLRKSADSYTVMGPWLVTADEIPDPGDLELALDVNGTRRQSASTRELILDVPALIAFTSAFYTLHPGDLLMTGTPQGVGPVTKGDRMDAMIGRIGSMTVAVH